MDDTGWVLFEGCSHSFHQICLLGISYCPLYQDFFKDKETSLATIAKSAFLNPKERNIEQNKESECNAPESKVVLMGH